VERDQRQPAGETAAGVAAAGRDGGNQLVIAEVDQVRFGGGAQARRTRPEGVARDPVGGEDAIRIHEAGAPGFIDVDRA